jgi:hypothetical protein
VTIKSKKLTHQTTAKFLFFSFFLVHPQILLEFFLPTRENKQAKKAKTEIFIIIITGFHKNIYTEFYIQ